MCLLLSMCVSERERVEGGASSKPILYRIQRTPGGVVGVVHESGTKTYLHIPIIPRESEMKTLLL